ETYLARDFFSFYRGMYELLFSEFHRKKINNTV
ncbi:MAG: hypothetical protein ACI90V_004788, partial [Bacillariaceae sp.]